MVQRLVNRFRRKTSIKSNEEALFYLENANMDMEAAYHAWIEDNEWEQNAPPFVLVFSIFSFYSLLSQFTYSSLL